MAELITIRQVQNQTTEGGQAYRRVQLAGGRWANVWDAAIELHQGGAYMAELESKPGKQPGVTFWRITSAVPSQAANGAAPTASPEGGRERRIQAECALKAAVETARSLPITDPSPIALQTLILDWADRYLTWLLANDGSSKLTDEPF